MVKAKRPSASDVKFHSHTSPLSSLISSLPPQVAEIINNQIIPHVKTATNILSTNKRAQVFAAVGLFVFTFLIFKSSSYSSVGAPPLTTTTGGATIRKAKEQQQETNLLLSTSSNTQQAAASGLSTTTTTTTTNPPATNAAAKCEWRPEPLLGICDGTKVTVESKLFPTAQLCEEGCCLSDTCVSWQYRKKEGCQFGGDTRLGAEGDGPGSWCEPRAPGAWHGQRIKVKETGEAVAGACSATGWNPKELSGQCFGLGSKRTNVKDNTPESCRDACCQDEKCAIWQWRKDSGCFYHKGGHSCQDANPLDYEAFVGKRKVLTVRSYTPYAYSKDFADMAGFEKRYNQEK